MKKCKKNSQFLCVFSFGPLFMKSGQIINLSTLQFACTWQLNEKFKRNTHVDIYIYILNQSHAILVKFFYHSCIWFSMNLTSNWSWSKMKKSFLNENEEVSLKFKFINLFQAKHNTFWVVTSEGRSNNRICGFYRQCCCKV